MSRLKQIIPGFTQVSTLSRLNSARFNAENRIYAHPLCGLGHNRFQVTKGWTVLGWATAPYGGSGEHAIVYEKGVPSDSDGPGRLDHVEPGTYWCHGDADLMWFCTTLPPDLEAEFNPWV